jgi:hypothetical protein
MNAIQRWLVRPYVHQELPGWGPINKDFVRDFRSDSLWVNEPSQIIRGKLHAHLMDVNMAQ